MPRIKIFILLLTLLAVGTLPAFSAPVTIRFSHVVGKDTPKGKASEYFKRLVEQRSNNRIRVDIYPDGTLFDDTKVLDALKYNAVQMAAPSLSKLSGIAPQLQLFDLPFLFHDTEHLHRVIDGEIGAELLADASREGLVALAFWDNGFKQLTANRGLIAPQDAAGLKMRIEGSAVQKAQFETLGATTLTIPFPRLYEALRNGEVDGQENTLSNVYNRRLYEVQSDLTLSNHGYLEYLVVVSERFWKGLPEDLKVIIRGAIKDAGEYTRDMAVQLNRDALYKLRNTNAIRIHKLSAPQQQAWQEKLRRIYPRFYDQIGANLVQRTMAQGAEK